MQTHQQHAAAQAQFAADQEAERKRLLKLVNTAAAQLRWRETGAWQVVKSQVGFYGSAADADIEQLEAILDHAKKCGFKVQHKTAGGGKSRPIDRTDPARKLRKLWLRGYALDIVHDPSEEALCSWASNSHAPNVTALLQSFGPDEWSAVIERLKKWLFKEVERGRLHCYDHGPIITSRKAATDIIWERPVLCGKCGKPMTWRPGPKREQRYGRRG